MIDVLIAAGFLVLGLINAVFFVIGFTCRQIFERTGNIKLKRPDKITDETKLTAIRPTKERFDELDGKEKEDPARPTKPWER